MERKWYAVYTKSRNEKKVAERLYSLGIEAYCPLQTTIRQWSDRKKKVQTPVIPSYVFVKIEESERQFVLEEPGVVRFVFWLGAPAIIKEQEIIMLKEFLNTYSSMKLTQVTYQPGDVVNVNSGPFNGQNAEIIKVDKGYASILLRGVGIELKARVKQESVN